jgi:biotin carboxylase
MKKIIFLGASFQQLSPIQYANSKGYTTITCDNRPENPGHKIASKSFDVSTIEKEEILEIARDEKIDGIISYASDISAPTAAYVAENLGLPGNPYESVRILTNKNLFRQFQRENGFYYPKSKNIDIPSDTDNRALISSLDGFADRLIIKPVDANACKGISIISKHDEVVDAVQYAAGYSISNRVIIEEYVDRKAYQICGEGFIQDGKIGFYSFANEHFSNSTIVPIGESFPTVFCEELVDKAASELQRVFSLLNISTGPFNVDLFFTEENEVFIIEIGPRNGGNRMPDAIKYACGVDTISATVESAIGNLVSLSRSFNNYISTYSIHTNEGGKLSEVIYSDEIKNNIVDELMFCHCGDQVESFTMGSNMIGNLILKFDTYIEMINKLDDMDKYIKVKLA